jgi:hypothetical protein
MQDMLCKLSRSVFVLGLVVGGLEGVAAATPVGGFSGAGPAMIDVGGSGNLCVGWSGEDIGTHLTISCSTNPTQSFPAAVPSNQTTQFTPSFAMLNGQLFVAWTGTDTRVNVALVDPANPGFLNANPVNNVVSSAAPALGTFNINGVDRLVVAWTGTDSHHHLNISTSFNGANWGTTTTLNQLATGGPSLTRFNNGNLYMGWTGTDSGHTENFAIWPVGSATPFPGTAMSVAGNTSDSDPSVATVVNFDYAWRGKDNRINIAFSSNGALPFGTIGIVGGGITTSTSPAIGSFQGLLWLAWIAMDGSVNVEKVP